MFARPEKIARPLIYGLLLAISACSQSAERPEQQPPPSHVMLFEDFELDHPGETWSFVEPGQWRVAVEGQRRFLQMAYPEPGQKSAASPRPERYALYNAYRFRSFSLSCRIRLDENKERGPRNACILFGYQDPENFYYLNLSSQKGVHRNTVVCVFRDAVKPLPLEAPVTPPPINDGSWHKIDVLRNVDTGMIEVYLDAYDKNAEPLMKVNDSTYKWGYIGFGAVQDHVSFAHLALQGEGRKALPPPHLKRAAVPAEQSISE